MLVYQRVNMSNLGGFIPIPVEFVDNFIMGFTDFSSDRTSSIMDFQWDFASSSGVHGVKMPKSVGQTPLTLGTTVIKRVGYTLFYMKTWICPNQTYFNPSKNLCTGCPI